jgi:hypothetical protein
MIAAVDRGAAVQDLGGFLSGYLFELFNWPLATYPLRIANPHRRSLSPKQRRKLSVMALDPKRAVVEASQKTPALRNWGFEPVLSISQLRSFRRVPATAPRSTSGAGESSNRILTTLV